MTDPREANVDVAIVGAGLAGLAAARKVSQTGRSFVVAEARDRVGGRTLNHDVGGGRCVDLGAQWTSPAQENIRALAAEFGIAVHSVPVDGRDLFHGADLPREDDSLAAAQELRRAVELLDEMAASVSCDAPWEAPDADRLDALSLGVWASEHLRNPVARARFNVVIEGFIASPDEISLLHALFYGRSNGGMASFFSIGERHDDEFFEGGSQQIALRLAEEAGDRLWLSRPARSIRQAGGDVEVLGDAFRIRARCVIVAMPPALTGRLTYDPPLPGVRDLLTQRTPLKAITKAQVVYERPFWKEAGLSGRIILRPASPVLVIMDGSPADGSYGAIVAYFDSVGSEQMGSFSMGERGKYVIDILTRGFGPPAADPIAYVDRYWADDEYSRGDVTYLPPGVWTRYGHMLRQPLGPIHWAGTETAIDFAGQMEGAISSGYRAAEEVLTALGAPPEMRETRRRQR